VKPYFGYVRVSTTRQGEWGVSLPEQREAIERYAARNELTLSFWFEEQQTAAKRGRPVWAKMLKLLRTRKAAGVIIHKIDRSARNLRDWADLAELIDQGIEVHFANEALDLASRGGRLSADIQAVVAADYIRNLREETKKGFYGRLKQGFYPMRAPIGYLNNGKAKPKTVDPERGPLIRKTFDLYLTAKFSIPELCSEMFRLGLRNLGGGKLSPNGMSTLLRNPFYTGVIRIERTGQYFAGNHPSLISPRAFQTVQDILDGRLAARPKKHDFVFRKAVKCRTCGYSLIGELQKGHVYYRCQTRTCPETGIREEAIEAAVETNLQRLIFSESEKDCFRMTIASLKANWIAEQERQITQMTLRLEQIAERMNRLTDAYIDQAVDREMFEERKAALLFERQELRQGLQKLTGNGSTIPESLQRFLELAGDAYFLYRGAFPEKKREMLKLTTSNLTVSAKTVDFAFSFAFQLVAEREKTLDGSPSKGQARTWNEMLRKLIQVISEHPEAVALPVRE
jgi:DNA invertase Pin-like site-specific DNA recombinase